MEPNAREEKQGMSSKAPFGSAIVFFTIAWGQSFIFPKSADAGADSFAIFATAIFVFLGFCALIIGIRLQVKGVKTIDPPSRRHLVWSLVAVFVIAVIGGVVIYFQR
ncbi:MAG: drug/metabolite transporter (DMT)-like permease [Verrucomicrobiales bacterium]|jgi:drug/metabolite transporter (DMT)-like permease